MKYLPDWVGPGINRQFRVTQDLHWDIGRRGSGWVLIAPAGTEFESSVPWALHWLFPPEDPLFLKSAAIHDTLLESGYRRAFADSQWFEAALSEGADPLRAWAAYSGMRTRRFILWALRGGKPNSSG